MTEPPAGSSPSPAEPDTGLGSGAQRSVTFGAWMGSMWLYTALRFGLFFVLWGLLALAGLHGFIAPLVGLVLSMPLSYVLLARPRARFAANIELRVNAHREHRAELDQKLEGLD